MLKMQKIPFMLIVGEEEENGTISIMQTWPGRKRQHYCYIEESAAIVEEEIKKTLKVFTV
jgi:threonyl-tRNA synthetase